MKKVIVINSSPRHGGNSDTIAEMLKEKIMGAEIKQINLREADVKPCLGCDGCKRKDTVFCVQKDDMGKLLTELDSCDALVLLSPIYFGAINGPMKTVVDRLYPFFSFTKENMSAATKFGKKAAVIVCCMSGPVDVCQAEADKYAATLAVAGFTNGKGYCAHDLMSKGAVKNNMEAVQKIDEIAAWISG